MGLFFQIDIWHEFPSQAHLEAGMDVFDKATSENKSLLNAVTYARTNPEDYTLMTFQDKIYGQAPNAEALVDAFQKTMAYATHGGIEILAEAEKVEEFDRLEAENPAPTTPPDGPRHFGWEMLVAISFYNLEAFRAALAAGGDPNFHGGAVLEAVLLKAKYVIDNPYIELGPEEGMVEYVKALVEKGVDGSKAGPWLDKLPAAFRWALFPEQAPKAEVAAAKADGKAGVLAAPLSRSARLAWAAELPAKHRELVELEYEYLDLCLAGKQNESKELSQKIYQLNIAIEKKLRPRMPGRMMGYVKRGLYQSISISGKELIAHGEELRKEWPILNLRLNGILWVWDDLLQSQLLQEVYSLSLSNCNINDAQLKEVVKGELAERIVWLDVSQNALTEESLAYLATFPNLKHVEFQGNKSDNPVPYTEDIYYDYNDLVTEYRIPRSNEAAQEKYGKLPWLVPKPRHLEKAWPEWFYPYAD